MLLCPTRISSAPGSPTKCETVNHCGDTASSRWVGPLGTCERVCLGKIPVMEDFVCSFPIGDSL